MWISFIWRRSANRSGQEAEALLSPGHIAATVGESWYCMALTQIKYMVTQKEELFSQGKVKRYMELSEIREVCAGYQENSDLLSA